MNSLFQVSEFINVFSVFGFPIDLGDEGGLMMVGPMDQVLVDLTAS